jgi:ceramide glucosyltransferase
VKLLWLLLFVASCGYQIVATVLAREFARRKPLKKKDGLRFSQIKPVREVSTDTLTAMESFLSIPGHEDRDFYVCSAHPAPEIWTKRWPQVTWLRLAAGKDARNGKAATLALGQKYWSGEIFIVSDADMVCGPDYLEAVLGEFQDPRVGAVTCLYRGGGPLSSGSILESLCILDFSSSVLVAERTEGVGFAMGSTMAIRREVLEEIGGFEALEPYLADDFQLGFRTAAKGWKVALAPTVLDTNLGAPSFRDALAHQYRWMVTSRVSRPMGHLAFVITQGLPWSLLITLWDAGLGSALLLFWFFLRVVLGGVQNSSLRGVAGGVRVWELLFLPVKDLLFLGIWAASLTGNQVRWGDEDILIDRQGRIESTTREM